MPGDFRILEARTGIGHFWVFFLGGGGGRGGFGRSTAISETIKGDTLLTFVEK